jgi:hypothetical protein
MIFGEMNQIGRVERGKLYRGQEGEGKEEEMEIECQSANAQPNTQ